MMTLIQSHGGTLALLVGFNVLMVALQKICEVLKIQEPAWIQAVGKIAGAMISAVSANTVAPAPAAAPQAPVAPQDTQKTG